MSASLWFDDLDFLPEDPAAELAADGFCFRAVADGTDFSNAEAIVSSIVSDLFDGSSHEVTGWESASLSLTVEVISPTPDGLSLGSERLIATCRKNGIRPLAITPEGTSVPSVWDVLVATFKHRYDDLAEVLHGAAPHHRRVYMLTLLCKPFARSDVAVSLPGLAVGGAYSETVVATGAVTTGWSTTSRYVTRRNLLKNPSFENGTSISPWQSGAFASSPTVVTDVGAPAGAKVLKVTTTAMASGVQSHMNAAVVSVVPGQSVPILHRIKAGHSSMTLAGTLYRWYDGAGNQIGSDVTPTPVALTTSAYATVSLTAVAPAGAVLLRTFPFVRVNSTQPAGRIWYLDASAIIEHETVATTSYFDGDTAPSGGLTYYWGSNSSEQTSPAIETGLGAVTASGGSVFPHGSSSTVPVIHIPAGDGVNLTYTGTIDVSSHRYIRIKAKHPLTLDLDGLRADHVASGVSGSYYVYHFAVPASITTSAASATLTAALVSDWAEAGLSVGEIATVSSPTAGTGRAVTRTVATVGSMPAEATVVVTNDGNPLGDDLIIHTGSEVGGFHLLRATRTAGPTQTVASTSISGLTSVLDDGGGTMDTFQIPVQQIPEATYLLTVYMSGTGTTDGTSYTFGWEASIVEDPAGTPVQHSIVSGTTSVTATGGAFIARPVDFGLITLPTTHMAVSGTDTAVVQIRIWRWTPFTGTWTWDEAWLADVDNGQISVVDLFDAGLTGEATGLEIVPAAADRPQQQYLATSGTAPNTTTREIIPTGWANHRFDPADGDAQVNVINTATTPGLSVAVEFYPRWDVFAAPIVTDEAP